MFTMNIKAVQKRWPSISDSDGRTQYHTRTLIDSLSVTDPDGKQGSIAVQNEMFLNKFPSGPVLEFEEGLLQSLQEASIRPYRMVFQKTVGGVVIQISDNYNRVSDLTKTYIPPVDITLTFNVGDFNWEVTLADGDTPVSGSGFEYSSSAVLLTDGITSTGLMITVPSQPSGSSVIWSRTSNYFINSTLIEFKGAWTADSYQDGASVLTEPGVTISKSGTNLLFTFGRGSSALTYELPWSQFSDGAWVELKDPADDSTVIVADKKPAGVSVRFGEGDIGLTQPLEYFRFEVAFLDSMDTIQSYMDSLLFQRGPDILDIEGSLDRYDELKAYYKSPRWVLTESGVPLLYTLQQDPVYDTYSWELFTGSIDPSSSPRVRTASAKEMSYSLSNADVEAKAVISVLEIFKEEYTEYLNLSFSTDTDEYPDSEEEFDI